MALLVDIEKKLGNFQLSMHFQAGDQILALLGASGCGKSMTLKCIAGIETPDRGRIILDGVTLFDSEKKINLPPQKRQVGYLFQQYALFPNMTVEGNIRCGLREKKNKKENEKRIQEVIQAMHLTGLEKKKPGQLSGGQQQRTALARILVNAPKLLLLDEPFSALDSHLRFQLEREVAQVARGFGKTVLLVSHNRDEVFRLSDAIAVMNQGSIDVMGTKKEIFAAPGTKTAAILTGCKNISDVERLDKGQIYAREWGIRLTHERTQEDFSAIGIRMHHIKLVEETPAPLLAGREDTDSLTPGKNENIFHCKVEEVIENPFSFTLMLRMSKDPGKKLLLLDLSKELWQTAKAQEIDISIPQEAILLLH